MDQVEFLLFEAGNDAEKLAVDLRRKLGTADTRGRPIDTDAILAPLHSAASHLLSTASARHYEPEE